MKKKPPDTVQLPVKPLCQGTTNACGTVALAMALNALQALNPHPAGVAANFTHDLLDPGNREFDSFSPPGMLVRVAEDYGFCAGMYNHTTFEELLGHLKQSHLVLALITVNPEVFHGALHYVVIHEAKAYDKHSLNTITYTDPATGKTRQQRYDEFVRKYWESLKLGGVRLHFTRFMIVVSNADDLPPHRDVPLSNTLATGLNHLINAVGILRRWVFRAKP